MKKLSLLFLIATCSYALGAKQPASFDIGALGGYSISGFNNYRQGYGQHAAITSGVYAGVTFQYNFHKYLSLYTDLAYDLKGYNIYYYTNLNGTKTSGLQTPYTLHYLTIPVLLKASVGKTIKFYGAVGIYGSVLLRAEVDNINLPVKKSDATYQFQPMDAGISIALGAHVPIAKTWSLSTELRGNLGLLNCYKQSQGNSKNLSLQLSVGVSYRFGRQKPKN